jgi:hypothetical protein
MDDRPGGWVHYFPSRHGTVGQMVRLAGAPAADPASEAWPRRPRFSGPPTWIRALVTVAEATWDMTAGALIQVPMERADAEIRAGRARLARMDEMPRDE